MRVLDRYLLRELGLSFGVGLASFITVLCLNMVYFALDLIIDKGAPLWQIAELVVLRIPFFLVLALPVAILLSVSLAVNRITRDRELVALRMAGLSLGRLLLPFLVGGVVLTVVAFATEEWVSPPATHQSDDLYRHLWMTASVPNLEPDTFFRADNRVFYFRRAFRVGSHTLELQQVMMYQLEAGDFPEVWTAREALVRGDIWTLKGVVIHHLDEHGWASVDAVPPQDVTLDLHREIGLFFQSQQLPEEMTAARLRREIRNDRRMGMVGRALDEMQYQYYSKFSLPLACLICALMGVPLNMRYARFGSFVGLLFALVVIFVYYVLMVSSQVMAQNGQMQPIVAAWLPDGVAALAALVLIFRER